MVGLVTIDQEEPLAIRVIAPDTSPLVGTKMTFSAERTRISVEWADCPEGREANGVSSSRHTGMGIICGDTTRDYLAALRRRMHDEARTDSTEGRSSRYPSRARGAKRKGPSKRTEPVRVDRTELPSSAWRQICRTKNPEQKGDKFTLSLRRAETHEA